MATPPTFQSATETVWNTTSPKTTAGFDANAGDVLVCVATTADQSYTCSTPTNSGTALTWTLVQSVAVANYCTAYVWSATVDANRTGMTVSVAASGSTQMYGIDVLRFSGSAGVGASGAANASGGPSLTFTTSYDNSAIVVLAADWNAADGTTRTWRSVNGSAATERTYFRDSSNYTLYVGTHADAGTAGSKTVGLSAPTGQKYSIVGLEIRGVASSGVTGTSAQTLPALTQSASGTRTLPAFTGTAAQTLPALTQSGSGAVTAPGFSGAAASALPALTQSGAGATVPPAFTGSGATTLPALTQAGAGAVGDIDVTGTAATTLPALTQSAAGGGAVLNLFSTTPSIAAATDNAVSLGVEFYVTASGKSLTKIRYLVPSSGANVSATRTCALYSTNDGYSGTLVAGPFTMPPGTAGQWCEYTLTTPYALTADVRYRAAVWHDANAGFAATSNYFSTGDGATTTTLGGFLVRPNLTDSVANRQGAYIYGASIDFPNESFNAGNYWTDVEVSGSGAVFTGAGASTLGALTQAAAGTFSTPGATGSSAQTLPALTQSGAGAVVNPAAGPAASTLPALTQSASGTYLDEYFDTYSGDIGTLLPALGQSGAGTADNPEGAAGAAASTLPALTQAAEGTRIVPESTGGATSALPSLTQSGAGTHTAPIYTAAIATALPALTQCARQSTSSQAPVVGGTVGAVGGSLGRVA